MTNGKKSSRLSNTPPSAKKPPNAPAQANMTTSPKKAPTSAPPAARNSSSPIPNSPPACACPSFSPATPADKALLVEDTSFAATRTEVLCAHCGGPPAHISDAAPQPPTGQRYCTTPIPLKFTPAATRPDTHPSD